MRTLKTSSPNTKFYARVAKEHNPNPLSLSSFSAEVKQENHRLPLLHKALEPLAANSAYFMKLLIGQFAIILLILGTGGLCYLAYSEASYKYAIVIALWTVVLILLGFWTRTNPKKAFLFTLVFYVSTVIVKDVLFGGEYLLTFLFHMYFVLSMVIGMNGTVEEFKRLSGS